MRVWLVFLIPLLACSAFASDDTKEIVAPGLGAKLDDYMRRLEAFDYSGTVLVEYKGQVILNKGYGYANREKHIRNRPDTVFEIGSLAKQFTATEILLLERAGKLKVTDSITTHLPELTDKHKGVTIQNLLNHTGGIPSVTGYKDDASREQMLRRVRDGELEFAPGTRFEYSNEGFMLLAAIIEKLTGKPYQDCMVESIFKPIGMTGTGFLGAHAAPLDSKRFALGYDDAGLTFDSLKAKGDNWAGMGCGDLTTDLPDLHRWFKTIFQSDFLTQEERKRMFTPVKPLDKPDGKWFSSEYGDGWFVQTLPDGNKRIQHGGDGYGMGSQFTWYPAEQLLVLSLCNVRHDVFPDSIRGGRVMSQIVLGEEHVEPPAVASRPQSFWKGLIGSYRLDTGDKLVIYRSGDRVMIGADGQTAATLLDQPPADEKAKIEFQETISNGSIEKLFARDYEFWRKLQGGKGFVDGVNDEIADYGKKLGKPLGARSLGTYEGGFADFASVWQLRFEHGTLPYKLAWTADGIRATWTDSPSYAAPTPLQASPNGNLVGWNLCTRRGFTIDVRGHALVIKGSEGSAVAHRISD